MREFVSLLDSLPPLFFGGVTVAALMLVRRLVRDAEQQVYETERLRREVEGMRDHLNDLRAKLAGIGASPPPSERLGATPPYLSPAPTQAADMGAARGALHRGAELTPEAAPTVPLAAQPAEIEYSEAAVRAMYGKWCSSRERARSTSLISIGHLAYDTAESQSDRAGGKRFLLRESPQLSEFVRFSAPDTIHGLVLPNPDANYTPVVAHVFPGVNRSDYDRPESLARLTPVRVRRRNEAQWETE